MVPASALSITTNQLPLISCALTNTISFAAIILYWMLRRGCNNSLSNLRTFNYLLIRNNLFLLWDLEGQFHCSIIWIDRFVRLLSFIIDSFSSADFVEVDSFEILSLFLFENSGFFLWRSNPRDCLFILFNSFLSNLFKLRVFEFSSLKLIELHSFLKEAWHQALKRLWD